MPKQHIYLPQKTLDKIKSMVDERLNNGATHADVNISKMCVEMMNIGIRAFEYHQNKNKQSEPEIDKMKVMMESLLKTQLCVQEILEMQFSLQEIKDDSRYNFTETKTQIIKDTLSGVEQFYPSKK
ncbi:TPA: relaxosome protein TraM [Providencia alcalifaciens]